MKEEILQAVITLLAVINPAVSAMILNQITKDDTTRARAKEAVLSILEILLILVVIAFIGKGILRIFSISIQSFQMVGGLVISYIGFTMLTGKIAGNETERSRKKNGRIDNSPLIMFAASPGTVATVITISLNDGSSIIPVITLSALVISLTVTGFILTILSFFPPKEKSGTSFATQFMGLVLIAMGLQYILDGLKEFMLF